MGASGVPAACGRLVGSRRELPVSIIGLSAVCVIPTLLDPKSLHF